MEHICKLFKEHIGQDSYVCVECSCIWLNIEITPEHTHSLINGTLQQIQSKEYKMIKLDSLRLGAIE